MGILSSKPSFFQGDQVAKLDDLYIANSPDEYTLLDLAGNGNAANLDNFIKTHPTISLDVKNKNGKNFLLLAARSGNLDTFKYALEKSLGYDLSIEGIALSAARSGNLDTFKYALEKSLGYDLSIEGIALSAARSGNLDTFKYALEKSLDYGLPIEQTNNEGKNAAQLALENGFQEIAEYFLNWNYQPKASFSL
jgi:ankyrin repeat protein